MNIFFRMIALVTGYLFGLFNTGRIISSKTKHDLTKEGSGNSGATNALRVLGWKAGLATFLGDACKTILPVLIFRILFRGDSSSFMISMYAGLGACLGHVFPIYNLKKGGKGVSSTCGFVLATKPVLAIIPLGTFIILAVTTGYVSLSSITAFMLVILEAVVTGIFFMSKVSSGSALEFIIIYSIIPLIGIYKHKENIIRLKNGTENRFGHH